MKRHLFTVLAALGAVSLGAASLGAGALMGASGLAPSIEREGSIEHRQQVHEIEAKPFDPALLDSLADWTQGAPIDAESLEGKVLLVAMVSVDDPQSMTTLASLARYQRLNGDKGLVVLAVHPDQGWEALSEKVGEGRVKVQVARDAGGALAAALRSDGFPDLYLVDRAGQLRYGDIETGSLPAAVGSLLRETGETSVANATMESIGAQREIQAEKARQPRVVDPQEYVDADWPEHNRGELYGADFQGKAPPVALGNETWITDPVDLDGKVLILDFWATWCPPCRKFSPILDEIQEQYKGRLVAMAIGGQREDERTVRKYVHETRHSYSHLFDADETLYKQLKVTGIPHTLVLSSDGVIRWQGFPLDPGFREAVDQIMKVDPMTAPRPDETGQSDDATADEHDG